MAVIHRLHKFHGSAREYKTPQDVTDKMQGKQPYNGAGLRSSEHIVGTNYIDGYWWVFTEELVMGPVP